MRQPLSTRYFPAFAAAGLYLLPSHAWAIPSPELLVGSVTSVSQLIALIAATLGGGAAVMNGRAGSSKRARAWLLGFAVLSIGSLTVNAIQWFDHDAQRTRRLESALHRSAQQPGTLKRDATLKDLSYAQQLKHPLGIDTDAAEITLDEVARNQRSDTVFIDVRETAETETGTLAGALAIRYPDFDAAQLDLAGKKAVVFCHNGSRSHEICEALAARGIPCQFIVGGLEKWVVEKRAMTGLSARSLEDLRAIPLYRNQRTLLDTKDVHALINNDKAVFVDVRYPKEFAAGHLPAAINLPIRREPTAALQIAIGQVPKRPVVMPCYDRTGCFFAEVLGLELTRAGFDVRGRYTVPAEYIVASTRPAYVEHWIADNQRGLWSRARDRVAEFVGWLSGLTSFPLAIALLAAMSRTLVLPLSLKAERDQIVSKTLEPEMAELRETLKSDPARHSRAVRALYSRHGLTPLRNLLALAFLPILALSTAAIQQHSIAAQQPFAWIPNLAGPDPYWILPFLFGLLIAAYLHLTLATSRRARLVVWLLAAPAFTATALVLGSAVDLYLVVSMLLLLMQRAIVSRHRPAAQPQTQSMAARIARWRLPAGVIALDDAASLLGHGNKAHRLARLKADGVTVPAGMLLTHAFLRQFANQTPRQRQLSLDKLWRIIDAPQLAVRSSAAAEDGAQHSFAGVFESELHVDRAGLEAAIGRVHASFSSPRAASYGFAAESGNVLLQRMIDAEFSGVMFTRDPVSACAMLVEAVEGTADGLVSGTVTPRAFRFGRTTFSRLDRTPPPLPLEPLLEIGRRAEALFGRPQDIEWTSYRGSFQIVQSRDIIQQSSPAEDADDIAQRDWARVLERAGASAADDIIFVQNEMSEMLPRPTPLSYSIMEELWASGGSVDLACRKLGLDYPVDEDAPSYLVSVVGRLYVDKRQEQARAATITKATLRRLENSAVQIEGAFRRGFLPPFLARMRMLEATAFERMSLPDLLVSIGELRARFVAETHVEVDVVNILASLFLQRAKTALRSAGLDPALTLAGAPPTAMVLAMANAVARGGPDREASLRAAFGHRSITDYELAALRYADTPAIMEALALASPGHAAQFADDQRLLMAGPAVLAAVERARKFLTLKEDAKHHSLREYNALRRALLALDAKLGFDGLVCFLTFDELPLLATEIATLRSTAERRRRVMQVLLDVPPPPSTLTAVDIERLATGSQLIAANDTGGVAGTRVAGARTVEGRCHRVSALDAETGAPLLGFEPGDIIVARMFHPAWLPYLQQCSGIVVELGGWLSHMALLAREHDIAMIVGVRSLASLPNGAQLRLLKSGTIELVGYGHPIEASVIAAAQ